MSRFCFLFSNLHYLLSANENDQFWSLNQSKRLKSYLCKLEKKRDILYIVNRLDFRKIESFQTFLEFQNFMEINSGFNKNHKISNEIIKKLLSGILLSHKLNNKISQFCQHSDIFPLKIELLTNQRVQYILAHPRSKSLFYTTLIPYLSGKWVNLPKRDIRYISYTRYVNIIIHMYVKWHF